MTVASRTPERLCRFAVREPDDVHGHERLAKVLAVARRPLRTARGVSMTVSGRSRGPVVGGLDLPPAAPWSAGREASPRGSPSGQERVAQHAQQVSEVVVAAQQARPGEDPGVGLLDQVLRVQARAGERPRRAKEAVEMIRQGLRVELAGGRGPHFPPAPCIPGR